MPSRQPAKTNPKSRYITLKDPNPDDALPWKVRLRGEVGKPGTVVEMAPTLSEALELQARRDRFDEHRGAIPPLPDES